MGKLHELLAIEADRKNVSGSMIAEAEQTFGRRHDHFLGQNTKTTYFSPDRAGENTESSKAVVTTVDDKLQFTLSHLASYWDVLYQKESANQAAKADVVVDGATLLKDVPATMLLGLESRLTDLRQRVVANIPTLDPAVTWAEDTQGAGVGIYRSAPTVAFPTEKALRHQVLVPVHDKHPAQVEKWHEDVRVARRETVTFSGMWPVAKKAATLNRLDKLIAAVKQARARANLTEAPNGKIAKAMLEFVFADTKL
jgi:hypothetical protein